MRHVTSARITCVIVTLLVQVRVNLGWSFLCKEKQCVRSEDPSDDVGTSLSVCRLTCGQFGAVWPQPTGYTAISDKVINIDPTHVRFDFSAVTDLDQGPVRNFVDATCGLFVANLQRLCGGNCSDTPETSVTVYLATLSGDLSLNWYTDEGYSLDVSTSDDMVTVRIQADTVYGARHGLETLIQLTTNADMQDRRNRQLVMVTTAQISDKPRYPHRGVLLDTARNYLPISALMRTLDAMASCKLNILHWHATDSQSFPLVLPTVPQLAKFGAYSAGEVYTMADVRSVVDYARLRGVRVLLELDMPAHAGNGWQWGPSHDAGDLAVCVNQQPWRQYCLQPPCGQLNPANPNVYRVLSDVFRDLVDTLPRGEAIHMGGDEVFFPCWNQSQEVTDWMKSRNLGLTQADFLKVWGEFHQKVLNEWDLQVGNEKSPVLLWSSHLTAADTIEQYLDKDRFVIEAWTEAQDPLATQLMDKGYRLILATKDSWYLDHGFWGRTQYRTWRRVYDNQLPRGRNLLGGEVAMWGELVDDHNLDGRIWPRATAAAERLWSDPDTDSRFAEDRLVEQRDRLLKRGVRPEAIQPQWCSQNQGLCWGSANNS